MSAWLVPISCQPPRKKPIAHWMEPTTSTAFMVEAVCGKLINPGFAKHVKGAKKCIACLRARGETTEAE